MEAIIIKSFEPKEGTSYLNSNIIRVSQSNPEYGSIMVQQTAFVLNGTMMNDVTRSAFINARLETLEKMCSIYRIKDGFNYSEIVGPKARIVIEERLESELPEDTKGFQEKINPSTGEVLTKNGEVIYRKSIVVTDDTCDVLISHDKVSAPVTSKATASATTKVF